MMIRLFTIASVIGYTGHNVKIIHNLSTYIGSGIIFGKIGNLNQPFVCEA